MYREYIIIKTEKPKAVSTRPRNQVPTAYTPGKYPEVPKTMITATVETKQDAQTQISDEIKALVSNKEAVAKILNWDTFDRFNIEPSDILKVETKGDILRFKLTGDRTIPISVGQLFYYWEQIKMNNAAHQTSEEPSPEKIVELAKEFGTVVWEHGCKLGYIIQYRKDFFAVTEVLTPTGFKYSHSLHGSFYLAHSELVERSWEMEVA